MKLETNNIIALLFILIIVLIVTNYCNNRKNFENFEGQSGNTNSVENSKNLEDDINTNISNLKTERNSLKDTITNNIKEKYDNKAQYLLDIKKKLNEQLEKEKENRETINTSQFEKIDIIKHSMNRLQQYIVNNVPEKEFNSIRSLQNGTKLSIDKIKDKPHYLVSLNNEKGFLNKNNIKNCLSVKSNGDYLIEECNENNEHQYFNMNNIETPNIYKNNLEKNIIGNKRLPNNVKYPFNLIKSNHNNNCLKNFNNHISVEPCATKKSHRWEPLEEQIYCSRDENENEYVDENKI